MGLEPDQGGGAGDCFVWFVAFVWGVCLGYGSPHSPPSMCFCSLVPADAHPGVARGKLVW